MKRSQSWSRCCGSPPLSSVCGAAKWGGHVSPVPWRCPHGVGSLPIWEAQVLLPPQLFYTQGLIHHPGLNHTKIDSLKLKEMFAQQIRLSCFLSQTHPLQGHCFVYGENTGSEASCYWAAFLFLAFQDLRISSNSPVNRLRKSMWSTTGRD